MTEIQLNMYHALALGAAMYALGLVLTKKIPVLSRFCIPAPLVGGLCLRSSTPFFTQQARQLSPLTIRCKRFL